MAIPDFQTIMLPLLEFIRDGEEHGIGETVDALAKRFKLSDDEAKQLLPSGTQAIFRNRVGWAKSYLNMADLIEFTRRGYFRIASQGKELLARAPTRVDISLLNKEYPAFVVARSKKRLATPSNDHAIDNGHVTEHEETPEERIETSFMELRGALASDLLDKIKKASPGFFERLVVDLLVRMGYGGSVQDAGQAIGRSGDEGIDGVIKEDRLGLDVIYIQAKRWDGKVGRPEIQKFAGALQGQRAHKGVFITTGSFTADADQFPKNIADKIVLIDGDRLADLMIDHQVGVATASTYEIKRIDEDYFTDE
jgi:restriction system protein